MEQKLPPGQRKLYQGIDEILWNEWDPIGMSEMQGPRDEYYSYVPRLFELALRDASPLDIADHLQSIAEEQMGLPSVTKDHLAVAEKIVALKLSLISKQGTA